MERIIVQGQEGDSLFAVVEGTVEVVLRREDGSEVQLGTRPDGTVLGEMSLLTGEPRSATVRAVDGALVYEVGRRQLQPLLAGAAGALRRAAGRDGRAPAHPGVVPRALRRGALRLESTRRLRRLVSSEELRARRRRPGGRGTRSTSSRTGAGQLVRLRQLDAVFGREDDRRGEAGEGEIGGGEAVAEEVLAAVGAALRRSRRTRAGPCARSSARSLSCELARRPADARTGRARERLRLPGRDALVVVRRASAPAAAACARRSGGGRQGRGRRRARGRAARPPGRR